MKDFDSAWLQEGAHHILHVLKNISRLNTPMLKVFRALEGVEPGYTVPWAAKTAWESLFGPKRAIIMNKQHVYLGSIFNIPIGLDYSWFLIFVLITWSLATSYYPAEFKGWPSPNTGSLGPVTAVLFFVSVLLHELGHSVIAMRYKIPVHSITLFIFRRDRPNRRGAAQRDSGILDRHCRTPGQFCLGSLLWAAAINCIQCGTPVGPGQVPGLHQWRIGLFNLIPGFPLDGGRVFRAIVWGITHNFQRAT